MRQAKEISRQKTVYDLRPGRGQIQKNATCYTHVIITEIDDTTVEAVFGFINTSGLVAIDPSTRMQITGENIPHDLIDPFTGTFKPFRLDIFARQLARLFASKRKPSHD